MGTASATKITRRSPLRISKRIGRHLSLGLALCAAALTAASVQPRPAAAQDYLARERAAEFDEAVIAYDQGDYVSAYETWHRLAHLGDLAAARNVATMLRLGQGVPVNKALALEFYEKAAEGGLTSAQLNAAFMLVEGDGVEADPEQAAKWFYQAAQSGVTLAQFNLGAMFDKGLGVPQDRNEARTWYEVAAKAGDEAAAERLAQLQASQAGRGTEIDGSLPPPPDLVTP